jgi:hypothetical protein
MQLDRILERLRDRKVDFVLVGGLAAYVYGVPMPTEDVDVCLDFTKDNLFRLADAVGDLHPRHRLTANPLPFEITEKNWSIFKNIYLHLDWGVLDCLGEVKGVGFYTDAVKVSQLLTFRFGQCPALTIEALIKAKEAAGRPHDLKAVGYLRALNGKKKTE